MAKYSDAQKEATARYTRRLMTGLMWSSKRDNARASRLSQPARERASTVSSAMPSNFR